MARPKHDYASHIANRIGTGAFDPIYDTKAGRAADRSGKAWAGTVIAVMLMVLAATNMISVERWAASQPPGWATETVRQIADLWDDRMAEAGLTAPREALAASYSEVKTTEWTEVEAWINEAAPAP